MSLDPATRLVQDETPPQRLVSALRQLGNARYHHLHPFNLLMHAGRLDAHDLRLWVANRYYYQTRIPIKDALILAKSEDPSFRRMWLQRLIDHDGIDDGVASSTRSRNLALATTSGLELWRRLGRACGVSDAELDAHSLVNARARQTCDEYVELVRNADLLTAVASSLTEYFAGSILRVRLESWKAHYRWIDGKALQYFEQRIVQAPADAESALSFLHQHLSSEQQLERCLGAVERKCEILWRLLDAVYVDARRQRIPRLRGSVSLHSSEPPSSALLLAPEKGYQLNHTGHALLERCTGDRQLDEIADELAQQYDGEPETVLLEMSPFVAELERRRVVEFAPRDAAETPC